MQGIVRKCDITENSLGLSGIGKTGIWLCCLILNCLSANPSSPSTTWKSILLTSVFALYMWEFVMLFYIIAGAVLCIGWTSRLYIIKLCLQIFQTYRSLRYRDCARLQDFNYVASVRKQYTDNWKQIMLAGIKDVVSCDTLLTWNKINSSSTQNDKIVVLFRR